MRAGIIGYGEVGSAFAALYRQRGLGEPVLVDEALGMKGRLGTCDVIHVCVPARAVHEVVTKRHLDPLYIVHSTVPVGTCRGLSEKGIRLVHAPVRGVHPHLAKSLETFIMPVGGPPPATGGDEPSDCHLQAAQVLQSIGIAADVWGPWEDTELAKLLCTTRLGVDVLWMRHVQDLCVKHGADFDRVYRQWTQAYNDGFTSLGSWFYARPLLKPQPGPIGGHCVMPNATMLAPDSDWAARVVAEGAKDWQPGAVPAKPA